MNAGEIKDLLSQTAAKESQWVWMTVSGAVERSFTELSSSRQTEWSKEETNDDAPQATHRPQPTAERYIVVKDRVAAGGVSPQALTLICQIHPDSHEV